MQHAAAVGPIALVWPKEALLDTVHRRISFGGPFVQLVVCRASVCCHGWNEAMLQQHVLLIRQVRCCFAILGERWSRHIQAIGIGMPVS